MKSFSLLLNPETTDPSNSYIIPTSLFHMYARFTLQSSHRVCIPRNDVFCDKKVIVTCSDIIIAIAITDPVSAVPFVPCLNLRSRQEINRSRLSQGLA
jgi:hypothetical protein